MRRLLFCCCCFFVLFSHVVTALFEVQPFILVVVQTSFVFIFVGFLFFLKLKKIFQKLFDDSGYMR